MKGTNKSVLENTISVTKVVLEEVLKTNNLTDCIIVKIMSFLIHKCCSFKICSRRLLNDKYITKSTISIIE